MYMYVCISMYVHCVILMSQAFVCLICDYVNKSNFSQDIHLLHVPSYSITTLKIYIEFIIVYLCAKLILQTY